MSTRCNIRVTSAGLPWEDDTIQLYRHTDGYPQCVIPQIYHAYMLAMRDPWRAGRAGKIASFLCAVAPGIVEPEPHHDLHSDIEYLYEIEAVNPEGGHTRDHPIWYVTTHVPTDQFWGGEPTADNMKLEIPRTDIRELFLLYPRSARTICRVCDAEIDYPLAVSQKEGQVHVK